MYGLDEKTLKLIGSPITEDVVIGIIRIKELYGKSHFDSLMTRERLDYNSRSEYLFQGLVKGDHRGTLVKIMEYRIIAHILSSYIIYNTYKKEFDKIHDPEYLSMKVFEI